MSEDPYYEAVLHATRDVFVHGGGLTGRVEQDKRMADRLRERFVVIDRADLPEVETEHWADGRTVLYGVTEPDLTYSPTQKQADQARKYAYAELAVAEAIEAHLREHPPVDQQQVEAIADAVDAAESESGKYGEPTTDFARRLYGYGVRVEKP